VKMIWSGVYMAMTSASGLRDLIFRIWRRSPPSRRVGLIHDDFKSHVLGELPDVGGVRLPQSVPSTRTPMLFGPYLSPG